MSDMAVVAALLPHMVWYMRVPCHIAGGSRRRLSRVVERSMPPLSLSLILITFLSPPRYHQRPAIADPTYA